MQTLYKHQQLFKDTKLNQDKILLCWEGGLGKTIGACLWLAHGRDEDALVISPKRVLKKWEDELKKWNTKATVLSKENFKKTPIKKWSAIVVDEADEFGSPLFTKGRSQLSTALYNLIKEYPDTPVLLATATPIRSSPANLHSLLCYLGHFIEWKKWRATFYSLEYRPYLPRPAWMPKPDWRMRIRPLLEQQAEIKLLKDCIDDVPAVAEEVVTLKRQPQIVEGNFFDRHRLEQEDKLKEILDIAKEYRKVLVVAFYVEQVESLANSLRKDRETFMVHGSVKKQEEILKEANESDECFLVIQASLGAGFDADTFSCVVFASMSYKVRDFVQMKYRVRRIHALHPVVYYYIIGGNCDDAVYKTIQKGRDFIPSEWDEKN
jgi:superfamily II DNA or RNA helicase